MQIIQVNYLLQVSNKMSRKQCSCLSRVCERGSMGEAHQWPTGEEATYRNPITIKLARQVIALMMKSRGGEVELFTAWLDQKCRNEGSVTQPLQLCLIIQRLPNMISLRTGSLSGKDLKSW